MTSDYQPNQVIHPNQEPDPVQPSHPSSSATVLSIGNKNNFWATKRVAMLLIFVTVAIVIQAITVLRAGGLTVVSDLEEGKAGSSVLVCEDPTANNGGFVQLGRVDGQQDC